jgi:cell shape-determining protein MreC
LTKGKVVQIGIFISLLGFFSYKLAPQIGVDNFTASTISSCILILIVITWVTSYVYRVVNGKMTFIEQRKRYRKEYEKVVNDKLETKFNALSKEEKEKLMEDLEKET